MCQFSEISFGESIDVGSEPAVVPEIGNTGSDSVDLAESAIVAEGISESVEFTESETIIEGLDDSLIAECALESISDVPDSDSLAGIEITGEDPTLEGFGDIESAEPIDFDIANDEADTTIDEGACVSDAFDSEQLNQEVQNTVSEETQDIPEAEDDSIDTSEIIKDFVDQNVITSKLPKSNGHWSDPELVGEGLWIPDDEASFSWEKGGSKHSMTYGDLKAQYGIEGMEYYNKEPNFEPFEDLNIGHVEIDDFPDHRSGTDGTYHAATESAAQRLGWSTSEVKNYMDENGLTWHECADRRTIRAIPTEINAAFAHTGGISVEKSMRAAASALNEQLDGESFVLDKTGGYYGPVESMDIQEIRADIKRKNRSYK